MTRVHGVLLIACLPLLLPSRGSAQALCPGGAAGEACSLQDPTPTLASASAVARELRFDADIDHAALVDASLKFSDNGLKQRLSFSPLRLRRDPTTWNGATIGVTSDANSTAFALALSYDQAEAYSPRRRHVAEGFDAPAVPPPDEGESPDHYKARVDSILVQAYSDYWRARIARTAAFALTPLLQTFSSLAASRVDLNDDGTIDNAYSLKSWGASAQLTLRPSFWSAVSLTGQLGKRRISPVEGTPARTYQGLALSASQVVKLLNPAYLYSKEYRSRLYVPSIAAGLSLTWQRCIGATLECEGGLDRQVSATPFADFRLPGGAQFRLALPLRHDRLGNKSGTRMDALLQLGWTMVGL